MGIQFIIIFNKSEFMKNFSDLHLKPEILNALNAMNFTEMTEVQESAIPAVLSLKI
jgi:superfamily II DNA/RNA helicase